MMYSYYIDRECRQVCVCVCVGGNARTRKRWARYGGSAKNMGFIRKFARVGTERNKITTTIYSKDFVEAAGAFSSRAYRGRLHAAVYIHLYDARVQRPVILTHTKKEKTSAPGRGPKPKVLQ